MENVVITLEVPEEQAVAFLQAGKVILAAMEASLKQAEQNREQGQVAPPAEGGQEALAAGLAASIQSQQPQLPGQR